MSSLLNLITSGLEYLSTSDSSTPPTLHSPDAMEPHSPIYADICVVRAMLKSLGLPTELVLEILAYAQYDPVLEFASDRRVSASATMGAAVSARVCLPAEILSPNTMRRISSPKVTLKVKEIEFQISSRDQGWTSEPTKGTFNTSSWLEVSIFRPGPSFRDLAVIPVLYSEYHTPEELQDQLRSRGHELVENRPADAEVGPQGGELPVSWYLQGNQVAERHFLKYRLVWAPGHYEGNEGTGKGQGFFEALQERDSVLIWARAKYPGWSCEVSRVKMIVRYGFVEPE